MNIATGKEHSMFFDFLLTFQGLFLHFNDKYIETFGYFNNLTAFVNHDIYCVDLNNLNCTRNTICPIITALHIHETYFHVLFDSILKLIP